MVIIKKYSNRRLYDTSRSQYVTLEELANHIRQGEDVQVQDAKTGEDLTQQVLAQIIIESRGAAKLLPSNMLTQLIRMEDDALADFFGHYMGWSLSFYLKAREGTRKRLSSLGAFAPPSPFSGALSGEAFSQWFQTMNAWNPMAQGGMPWSQKAHAQNMYQEPPPYPEDDGEFSEPSEVAESKQGEGKEEVAKMRAELDEIKVLLKLAVQQNQGE